VQAQDINVNAVTSAKTIRRPVGEAPSLKALLPIKSFEPSVHWPIHGNLQKNPQTIEDLKNEKLIGA
jgi:hypothetical protein